MGFSSDDLRMARLMFELRNETRSVAVQEEAR